jgi:alpha-1,6-mannosyltransferase
MQGSTTLAQAPPAGAPTSIVAPPRRPRVLDITDFYSDTTSGGVKTYLRAKSAAFAALGVPHAIVVPGERTEVSTLGSSTLYRVKGPALVASRAYRVMFSTRAVREIVRAERPDIVEVGSPFIVPHLVKRVTGCDYATIGFYHADVVRTFAEPYVPNRFAAPLRVLARMAARRLVGRVYSGFDATVAASESVAAELTALGVPNVRVVGLGVDLDAFHPSAAGPHSDVWGHEPGVPVALYVGRFCAEKRLEVALEGHARIPIERRPHLVLVGGGPHAERLRARARAHPSLSVVPYVADRAALARFYASADFYLAPGPGETFCLSIAEAMASGLPVVAVDRGAARDRLEGSGVGELYHHGDPASAALAMERMVARLTPDLRLRARSHAERHFSWSGTFSSLLALYQELTAARRA